MAMRDFRLAPLMAAGIVGLLAGVVSADDVADARKVVGSFLTAVQAGDEQAATSVVSTAPEYKTVVDTYLSLMLATTELQKAAAAKFGSSAAERFGAASGPEVDARQRATLEAPIKVVGDSAILTIPPDAAAKKTGGTIVLRKSAGTWKIDGASLFNVTGGTADETAKKAALAGKLLAITRQTTKEINSGEYAAAVDAYQKIWERFVKAAKDVDAGKEAAVAATTQAAAK